MAYCIQCDANTEYFLKDVWGTKTIQKTVRNNRNEDIGYVEEHVECIVRQDPLCCNCKSYIKHTNAYSRKDFLKIEEDTIFEANVMWPIFIVLFLCVGIPLGMATWNWASGLGAFVATFCVSVILPMGLTHVAISFMSLKLKRLMTLSMSTLKSSLKFGFLGLVAGSVLNAVLLGLHFPKIIEPFVLLASFGGIIYWGVKKDITELKALFDIFDEQLYEKVEGAYEEMNNDNGTQKKDIDHNLAACYAIFDLTTEASMEQVSIKYKKLMMKFHPDKLEHLKNKFPNEYTRSQEISKKLNAAYSYIKEAKEKSGAA